MSLEAGSEPPKCGMSWEGARQVVWGIGGFIVGTLEENPGVPHSTCPSVSLRLGTAPGAPQCPPRPGIAPWCPQTRYSPSCPPVPPRRGTAPPVRAEEPCGDIGMCQLCCLTSHIESPSLELGGAWGGSGSHREPEAALPPQRDRALCPGTALLPREGSGTRVSPSSSVGTPAPTRAGREGHGTLLCLPTWNWDTHSTPSPPHGAAAPARLSLSRGNCSTFPPANATSQSPAARAPGGRGAEPSTLPLQLHIPPKHSQNPIIN